MIAAPFATHILASLGAEVIKVEPPSGDTTRSLVRGGPSGTIVAYSHGKKDICLDLTTAAGKEVFLRLAASADVVIHNLAPSAARKLGVTAADCSAVTSAGVAACAVELTSSASVRTMEDRKSGTRKSQPR